MKLGRGFDPMVEELRKEFEGGSYRAFMEALLLCTWNELPLPEWVAKQTIDNAEYVFEHQPKGRGQQGNWRALGDAKAIEDRRADLVHMHLRRCREEGRRLLSMWAPLHGYGRRHPARPGFNIVTREDIYKFVAKQLRGTFARGTARQIADAYREAKKAGRYG